MIQLDRISKQFAGRTVLNEVSLAINAGDRIGLVGPNGTGKTTLFRIMAGLEPPDAGSVVSARDLRIGLLPQEIVPGNPNGVLDEMLRDFPAYRRYHELLDTRVDPATGVELAHLQEELVHELGYGVEARADEILAGLGFDEVHRNRRVDQLSGGFRMRVELARLLLLKHDLLLLDEPTNHLDMESMLWLEEYLSGFRGAMVIVAHDRVFLNHFATRIAHLERGTLSLVKGNYDEFLASKAESEDRLRHEYDKQQKEIRHLQSYIDKYIGQPKRSRMVSSRKKMLERLERVELPPPPPKPIRIEMPPVERSASEVVALHHIRKSFPSTRLYDDVSLTIYRSEKVALVGPNGSGKTTLLRIMARVTDPDSGDVSYGPGVTPFYYSQHHLEGLTAEWTVLEEALSVAGTNPAQTVRNILGAFRFVGDRVDDRVAILSGGEKARLALSKMILCLPNLLLLDEPTNHLDMSSREVLIDALQQYNGTVVFISHDRFFIDQIATRLVEVYRGELSSHPGNFSDYFPRSRFLGRAKPARPATLERPAENGGRDKSARRKDKDRKRREAEERNRRHRATRKVRERLARVEAEIEELERRQKAIHEELAKPSSYDDYDVYLELLAKSEQVERRIVARYRDWEELSAAIDEAIGSD